MELKLLDSLFLRGGRTNDDGLGHTPHAAWVADGATGLNPQRLLREGDSDAAWLAETIGEHLQTIRPQRSASIDITGNLAPVMEGLAHHLRRRFDEARITPEPTGPVELPSAALSMILLQGNMLSRINIGDCRQALISADGKKVESFGTSRRTELDARLIALLRERQAGNDKPIGQLWAEMLPEIIADRGHKNVPGGYWVVEPSTNWLDQVQIRRVKARPGIRFLIMSDGFSRLVDTVAAYPDDRALACAACAQGLEPLGKELRRLENSDPNCRTYPRLKPQDDATALLVEVVGEKVKYPQLPHQWQPGLIS